MLPILKTIEFSKILPLSEKSIQRINLKDGVNKFLAENGSGKTTLTDIIELSLVRDAHAYTWNIFAKKRVDRTAYIRGEWLFGSKKNSITHELTDAGARTRVTSPTFSNKAHTREMYSDFLYEQTNLYLESMRTLFEGMYYKRENDLNLLSTPGDENLMEFFELLNKVIRMETPATIKLRNKIGELRRQINMRKKKKRKIEGRIEKLEALFEEAESSAEVIDSIGQRKGDIQRTNEKLRHEIEENKQKLNNLEEEDQEILDKLNHKQEQLVELRLKIDRLKSEHFTLENELEKLQKELSGYEKISNNDYSEIKDKWKEKATCELCGTLIYDHWTERLEDGCPVCGTTWKELPDNLQEVITKEKSTLDTTNIKKDIEEVTHKLRTTAEDLNMKKRQEEEINEDLKHLRDRLTINNSRRRELQKENDQINEKIQRMQMEIGSLSAQEKMINQEVSIGLLRLQLEKLTDEINDYSVKLEQLEKKLPEQEELQKILNNFTKTTKELFGYSMLADTETRTITISKDGSHRDFAAMSWSERYFIDVVFRIAIFRFLIENKIIPRGFIILDSPEAALDPHRLSLLAELINKHSGKITFIVATRVKNFYDALSGQRLEIKKETQTSLFDFINA
ncbi:MAG: hypothetical protein U9O98_06100 [Asgard group archaeon]|nr:hypothetical protein [Asgard group archaeon]